MRDGVFHEQGRGYRLHPGAGPGTGTGGIAVNCVAPGIIDTRMNACFDRAELEAEVPMGRLGTPREVAEAVLYLAESPYVTGQVLGVNGGIV